MKCRFPKTVPYVVTDFYACHCDSSNAGFSFAMAYGRTLSCHPSNWHWQQNQRNIWNPQAVFRVFGPQIIQEPGPRLVCLGLLTTSGSSFDARLGRGQVSQDGSRILEQMLRCMLPLKSFKVHTMMWQKNDTTSGFIDYIIWEFCWRIILNLHDFWSN